MSRHNQVILISPNGALTSLVAEKGFDVKRLGLAQIHRVSSIEWSAQDQCWQIRMLRGLWAGAVITAAHLAMLNAGGCDSITEAGAAAYSTYERAVESEISLINQARKQGKNHFIEDSNAD